jgi:predicted dehydrogenase
MTALRLIVVGLGARAQTWLRVIRDNPDVQIAALCDPDPSARARAADAFPGMRIGADLADVIAVGADAVLLATPPFGRYSQIETCCKHRLPMLVEKPLADDVATAALYVAMAETAGVPLIVGLNFRFLAVTKALKGLLEAETVGKPEFARFTYERWRDGTLAQLNKYPLTMAHPMLWEQSIHHFDLMRHVYQTEPVRVFARAFNPSWSMYAGDANISALFEFQNGIGVNYQGTWAGNWARLDFEWRTDCTLGVVVQREMFGTLGYALRGMPELQPVPLPPHEHWITDAADLLAAFVQIVRGTTAPLCTGRDHLRSLLMLQACITSSQRQEALELAEIEDGIVKVL